MELLKTILSWGEEQPKKVAHKHSLDQMTYGELSDKAYRLASYLDERFGSNRSPIVIYGHKECEMLVAFLGITLSGRAYVPVDTIVPRDRAQYIAEAVDAPLILTPSSIAEIVTSQTRRNSTFSPLSDTDPFYIMFTSGSTGQPKGVVISLGCLEDFIQWMMEEQSFNVTNEVFLNQAPFSFDLSVMDLYLSLYTGGTLFSLTRDEVSNPAVLYNVLRNCEATVWVSTPSFAQLCVQEPSFSEQMLPHLNRFLFCGESLPRLLSEELIARFPSSLVWNTYGPTEATVATTSIKIDRDVLNQNDSVPIGYSKPRTKILIMDESGGVKNDDSRGEIVIVGPNVAYGYIGQPELSSKVFFEYEGMRAYRTGDWGYYKGEILFCEGRKDTQIKLHGYRIELGEIEAHMRKLPNIKDVVVTPKIKDGKAEYLGAFIILSEETNESDFELMRGLKKRLAQTLPVYMIPQRIFKLPVFPLTTNGKIDRKVLSERLA